MPTPAQQQSNAFEAPQTAAVVSLADYKNRDVVKICEGLLRKAIAGELTGLIYAARLREQDRPVSAAGVYAKDAAIALPAMDRASQILDGYVRRHSSTPND